MSVRHALLALLAEGPMYGYQLRHEFQTRTGEAWPLNIGQVYTTLGRLQRDGLVVEVDRRDDGSVVYALTGPGRSEAMSWWSNPVARQAAGRDELAIKIALACATPGVDVPSVVQRQRAESLRALQQLIRQVADLTGPGGGAASADRLAALLVLDRLVAATEAEVRWLDQVEHRVALTRAASPGWEGPPGTPPNPVSAHTNGVA